MAIQYVLTPTNLKPTDPSQVTVKTWDDKPVDLAAPVTILSDTKVTFSVFENNNYKVFIKNHSQVDQYNVTISKPPVPPVFDLKDTGDVSLPVPSDLQGLILARRTGNVVNIFFRMSKEAARTYMDSSGSFVYSAGILPVGWRPSKEDYYQGLTRAYKTDAADDNAANYLNALFILATNGDLRVAPIRTDSDAVVFSGPGMAALVRTTFFTNDPFPS